MTIPIRPYANDASPPASSRYGVVVCGGGASAALFLAALARETLPSKDIAVVEGRCRIGPGLAYSTTCEHHLMNVPVRALDIHDNACGDFLQWLKRSDSHGESAHGPGDFVPRRLYGNYLQACVSQLSSRLRVSHVRDFVMHAEWHGPVWRIVLASGRILESDILVLATGNEPPNPLATNTPVELRPFVLDDVWDGRGKSAIGRSDSVLLAGAGLTAIDIAIELLESGHQGDIIFASRHALLPQIHVIPCEPVSMFRTQADDLAMLTARFRNLAERTGEPCGWRAVIDGLRSHIPEIWQALSVADQRRFLRHVKPYWNAFRHRVAPEIGSRIAHAIARGRLSLMRGRITSIKGGAGIRRLAVFLATQGRTRSLAVDWVVNCTGPREAIAKTSNPILVSLLKQGLARPDRLGLGLDVNRHSRVLAASGQAHDRLYALGNLTKGRWWEITAIPEIRRQAHRVASEISMYQHRRVEEPVA